MTWYLFRHALATYSTEGYGSEIYSAGILPEAIPPIRRMGAYLKTVSGGRNFTSAFRRCRQTAEIIHAVTGREFTVDTRLNEYHDITYSRFIAGLETWIGENRKSGTDTVIACTHGAVIAALRHLIREGKTGPDDLPDYPPCGQLLVLEDSSETVLDFNERRSSP